MPPKKKFLVAQIVLARDASLEDSSTVLFSLEKQGGKVLTPSSSFFLLGAKRKKLEKAHWTAPVSIVAYEFKPARIKSVRDVLDRLLNTNPSLKAYNLAGPRTDISRFEPGVRDSKKPRVKPNYLGDEAPAKIPDPPKPSKSDLKLMSQKRPKP